MRRLNRYVGVTVAKAILVVLLVIVGLDALFGIIEEFTDLKGNYTGQDAFVFIGLSIPGRLVIYLPYAALVGCLIGLGMLAGTSELVVMRAAGVSVLRITGMVLRPVIMFVVGAFLLGEYVSPVTDQMALSGRALALGENLTRDVNEGLWSKEGNEYIHMGAVEPNGRLHSLTRYRYGETGHLESNSYAETALFQGGHWLEENIVETVFDGATIATVNYAMREWRTSITPELLNLLTLDPNAMATQALFDFARYREEQGFSADEHWLAFWTKALQPLATVSLVLVAIAFIFGPLRQTTTGYRVFIGVMVGVGFRTVQALLGPSSLVFDFPPVIAVAVPIAVCAAMGVWVLKNYR